MTPITFPPITAGTDRILAWCEATGKQQAEGSDRASAATYEAGYLRVFVRQQGDELDRLTGRGLNNPDCAETIELSMGVAKVKVAYHYEPATEPDRSGHPDTWEPGMPEELDMIAVLINGAWVDIDPETIGQDQIEAWDKAILASMEAPTVPLQALRVKHFRVAEVAEVAHV